MKRGIDDEGFIYYEEYKQPRFTFLSRINRPRASNNYPVRSRILSRSKATELFNKLAAKVKR